MRVEWREELATGKESIDRPKQELIERTNNLLHACRERKARNEFAGFFEYLKRYVRDPLLEEESFQLINGYPFFREHRKEHDLFVQRLIAVEEEFVREGGTALVIFTAGKLVLDWVHGHIYQSDALMAKNINN